MTISKNLKKILVAGAALVMVASSGAGLANNVNAKRRYRTRTHRVWNKRYHTGHFYHGRWYHYKTGYFNRSWHWVANRKAKRVISRRKPRHAKRVQKIDNKAHLFNAGSEYGEVYYRGFPSASAARRAIRKHAIKLTYTNGGGNMIIVPKNYSVEASAHHNHSHKNTNSNIIPEAESQTIKDINNEREQNGLSPLQESSQLDQFARQRANQIRTDFSHDGSSDSYGENIGYDNESGKKTANFVNNEMMYHDADSNWGHRANILSPNYTQIGVGASTKNEHYITSNMPNTYIAEEFY